MWVEDTNREIDSLTSKVESWDEKSKWDVMRNLWLKIDNALSKLESSMKTMNVSEEDRNKMKAEFASKLNDLKTNVDINFDTKKSITWIVAISLAASDPGYLDSIFDTWWRDFFWSFDTDDENDIKSAIFQILETPLEKFDNKDSLQWKVNDRYDAISNAAWMWYSNNDSTLWWERLKLNEK